MIKKIKNKGYKVTGVDNIINNIVFNHVLREGLYAVPYYQLYVKDPEDRTIAKIVLRDLVKKYGITNTANTIGVDYTTIYRNYKKPGTRISTHLANLILKNDHVTQNIEVTRVVLRACLNEFLISEWNKNKNRKQKE